MTKATLLQLHRILDFVSALLAADKQLSEKLRLSMDEAAEYHGFKKVKFPASVTERAAAHQQLPAESIQLELVYVGADLSDQVHMHLESDAYVEILGSEYGFKKPRYAQAFFSRLDKASGSWRNIEDAYQIYIPSGMPHGFRVREGGVLYFLSVQSPPIERADGHDDYHLVPVSTLNLS